ncbi:dethiobiotin synthase, partial [Roseisolibacter sp. H3M3-2]|uniref:ATP-dependent dethiobiotin synthetase BioD n=1 Tax=Roseisolibacter sp. H3M3-2 TaxID=3031323 RepID=UPI0023DAD4BF
LPKTAWPPTSLDLARLDAAAGRCAGGADALVVEGAGGLLVPFAPGLDLADLEARWSLDLVVVAGNRLGVLNHTLLTVREAARRGRQVRAVALNALHGGPPDLAGATIAGALRGLLGAVPLVTVPHLDGVAQEDPAALAAAGDALARVLLAPP